MEVAKNVFNLDDDSFDEDDSTSIVLLTLTASRNRFKQWKSCKKEISE